MDAGSQNPFTLKAGIAEEQSFMGTLLTNQCQLRRSPQPGLASTSGGTKGFRRKPSGEALPSSLSFILALHRKGKGSHDPRGSDRLYLIVVTLMKGLYRAMSMWQKQARFLRVIQY